MKSRNMIGFGILLREETIHKGERKPRANTKEINYSRTLEKKKRTRKYDGWKH